MVRKENAPKHPELYTIKAIYEIDGETVETGSDFIFGGSKITADGDCSHARLGQAPISQWEK